MSTYTVKWKDDNDKTITTVIANVSKTEAEAAIEAELTEARECYGLELSRETFVMTEDEQELTKAQIAKTLTTQIDEDDGVMEAIQNAMTFYCESRGLDIDDFYVDYKVEVREMTDEDR